MKKSLILAIALLAVVSQAASIDWRVTTTRNTYFFDSVGNNYTGSVYLILADDASKLDTSSLEAFQTSLTPITLDSKAITGGNYKIDPAKTATSDLLSTDASDPYSFQLLFLDVANKKYALSGIPEAKYAYSITDGDDAVTVSFVASQLGAAKTAAESTTVWKSIPEPATGALALAGLALLFRRKRA